jgi:large subunit ribosomal protein L7/L12
VLGMKTILTYSQEKPKEKTMFNVRLESFDAASKAKVIREVKATIANMNLMEVGTGFKSYTRSLTKAP